MKISVHFWGVRGSVGGGDRRTVGYGSHTACVSICYKDFWFVCDAGTGIYPLGQYLKEKSGSIALFVSHLHWDHIFGLPFFYPLYERGRKVLLAGPKDKKNSFRQLVEKIMRPPYFPLTPKHWLAKVEWKNLEEEVMSVGTVKVESKKIYHHGHALGFQFIFPKGERVVYVTDHELQKREEFFSKWIHGADLLIHDTHFSRNEYQTKKGWGHSSFEDVLDLAMAHAVKKLVLFHHHPLASDKILKKRLLWCQKKIHKNKSPIQVFLAKEGMTILV